MEKYLKKFEKQRKTIYLSEELTEVSKTQLEDKLKMPYLEVVGRCEVRNSHMAALYGLRRAEYQARLGHVQEEEVFFTTSASHACTLARDNFNWRTSRGGECGAGVTLSRDPEYSNYLCKSKSPVWAVLVVKVLVGKTCRGYSFMDFPPPGFDTTTDSEARLVTKYQDHEVLPTHVVFFPRPGGPLQKYYYQTFQQERQSAARGAPKTTRRQRKESETNSIRSLV